MDWNELRRQRLAKDYGDLTTPLPKRGLTGTDWAAELRDFFTALTLWQQATITGVVFLLLFAAPVVIFAFTRGGGGEKSVNSGPVVPPVQLSETFTPTATFEQLRTTPTPLQNLPTVEANREDCDAIRGSSYQSEAEQLWFLANCEAPTEPPPPPGGGPGPQPTEPPPPAPTPKQDTGFTASEAISRAVSWLTSQGITVSASSCSAGRSGSNWTVSCEDNTVVCIQQGPVVVWLC